jgi:sialic acid synthase SpsE
MQPMRIGQREVGENAPVFVIAEAGVNHNGSLETALELIDVAAEAGCDAVKFQKRNVRAMLSREAYDRPYDNGGHSYGRTYGEHRENMELSFAQWSRLRVHAHERGILLMGSAWDELSANELELIEVPAHKIGSPDLTNLPLCHHIAGFGKPVILSCGMSELWEIDAAVRTIRARNRQLILLHCVSIYPAPYAELNLQCIGLLRQRYDVLTGFSGHELGWHAVIAAVALGAKVVEKHITLDRTMKGGDHRFSLEPDEVARMVTEIRDVEAALAGAEKRVLPRERPFRGKLGKSVTTKVPVQSGTTLTLDMLTCKSPGTGVSALHLHELVGRTMTRDLDADSVVQPEDVLPRLEESA